MRSWGDGISKYFMTPYNFKVWAHPTEMMNREWIDERVAVLDINRATKNVVLDTDDFGRTTGSSSPIAAAWARSTGASRSRSKATSN